MAEFKTVLKEHDRMCRSFSGVCKECPLGKQRGVFTCLKWIFDNSYESEKLIMSWAKMNPMKTNQDKFKEVFGFDFKTTFTASPWTLEWLDEEYKEPNNE